MELFSDYLFVCPRLGSPSRPRASSRWSVSWTNWVSWWWRSPMSAIRFLCRNLRWKSGSSTSSTTSSRGNAAHMHVPASPHTGFLPCISLQRLQGLRKKKKKWNKKWGIKIRHKDMKTLPLHSQHKRMQYEELNTAVEYRFWTPLELHSIPIIVMKCLQQNFLIHIRDRKQKKCCLWWITQNKNWDFLQIHPIQIWTKQCSSWLNVPALKYTALKRFHTDF